MRTSIFVMLIAAVLSHQGVADCRSPVQPISVRELPQYAAARSVAWRDDRRVLIGTRSSGIVEYDLSTNRGRTLPGTQSIDDIENLDTDGKTVVAFNRDHTDVVYDLTTETIVHKRRKAVMRVMDAAVRDGQVAILGFSFDKNSPGGPLWIGKAGADWREYKLLYDKSKKADAFFRTAVSPYAGAVKFVDAKTVAIITPFARGVRLWDGTKLSTLGGDMTALETNLTPMIQDNDLAKRYRELNKVHLADDLVVLPEGPALIVRNGVKGNVRWSLWLPAANAPTPKWPLAIESNKADGVHMRCDARARKLVCIISGDPPRLTLFDTAKAVGCK